MGNWNERWGEVIKNMDLGKREPIWQKAIEHLLAKDAIEPTMSNELSQEWLQDIIVAISDDPAYESIIDVMSDFSRWFVGVRLDSLPDYVVSGKELWLLYTMLRFWDMVWDGNDWVELEREEPTENEISEAFFEKFERGEYDTEAP